MKKALSEMSLNELWELFPIFLTEHRSQWAVWYREEEQRLFTVLGQMNVKINHIGSTAIKAIWAKPIVDILIHGVTGGVYKARERIHRGMLIRDY